MLTLHQYAVLLSLLQGKGGNGTEKIELRPGMGFGALEKWWSRNEMRCRPHEGVDILCFDDGRRNKHFLGPGGKVPCLLTGEIIAICDDFLGQSVFVKGEDASLGDIIAVHAHILPQGRCGNRSVVGTEIGVVAPGKGSVPPHLHLSLLMLPPEFSMTDLHWEFLNQCGQELFLNPFSEVDSLSVPPVK